MNIFDPDLSGITRVDMYRAAVMPELYPNEKPMRIQNWCAEDIEMYVGGTK